MYIFPKVSFMQKNADLGVAETDFVAPTFQAVCVVLFPYKIGTQNHDFFPSSEHRALASTNGIIRNYITHRVSDQIVGCM